MSEKLDADYEKLFKEKTDLQIEHDRVVAKCENQASIISTLSLDCARKDGIISE